MAELEPGSVFAGHRIEAALGRGGMGVVYRATHLALERPVALKVMSSSLVEDPGFRGRFQRESRIAASLDHPHVVPVHDAGEEDGVLYITMQLIDGDDLQAVLRQEGSLDPDRAARLTAQIASALDAAHDRGLVHRDVKPANVLRTWRGGSEHLYLTDFGLTKSTRSNANLTDTGEWVGTLDYISPEQIRGDGIDARTDVYSLGCVLYQVLSGQVPFPATNFATKVWAHLNDRPPPLAEAAPGVSAGLAAVVDKAMAKDPAARYESAGGFAAAVSEVVAADGQTRVRARPAPPPPATDGGGQLTVPSARPAATHASAPAPTQRGRTRSALRKWWVRVAVLALVVAAAVLGAALAPGGGDDPVDRDDVLVLLDRYQANLTNERIDGLERLLSPTFTRGTLADPPVDRAAALNGYRQLFGSRRQPRFSLEDVSIDTKAGGATVRGRFVRTTPGRLVLGDVGTVVLTLEESDGQLLIDSVRNFPDLIVAPARLSDEQLPARVDVVATARIGDRQLQVAKGRHRLEANTETIAFPLTEEARRTLRTRQPVEVSVTTRPAGGGPPIRDRYSTDFR
jgi:hypothetical protein